MTYNNSFLDDKQRLTQKQKDAKDKLYYRNQLDLLDSKSFNNNSFTAFGTGVSDYRRKKVNYDLFNNIIDVNDFKYVCKPFGAEAGDLPAKFTNRDIVSGKIKVLLGMEMSMPFSWRIVATNPSATTRREQKESEMLKDFVTGEIMRPIRLETEQQLMQQASGGKPLTPEQKQQIAQQVEQEVQARTPDEVYKYMAREHQDPAESLAQQVLEYLIHEQKIPQKFNKGWKHTNISGEEIYYVGIENGEPVLKVINPLFFDYGRSHENEAIQDAEWATYELNLTPSQIVAVFGSELTNSEIDRIYSHYENKGSSIRDADFTFDTERHNEAYTVRVLHGAWKGLCKIGFLTYFDKRGKEQMKLVDENYKLDIENGDIKIEWEWIPEAHEGFKILDDIYVQCRPVPGQYKDLDNLYKCHLPYYGAACDNLNSPTTSPMDRMKGYQYYYDIILYRVDLMMASDKGKILAANIKLIPKSSGIDIIKWQYFAEANKMAWFNPMEEGNKGTGNMGEIAQVLDMSLASDIDKYIKIAEYIETKCGQSIGVTKQMEAQIAANEPVTNTKQNIIQASHIIKPHFELHNYVKRDVLEALLEKAKVAWRGSKPKKLVYILDDMTYKMITVDTELLDSSTYGLFVANSSKAHDAKQVVEGLAQAAIQNQQADLSDIMKIVRAESITEAEELLEAANLRKTQENQAIEQQKIQAQKQLEDQKMAFEREKMAHEKDMVVTKETERRKTEIQKQTILSLGFNEDKDLDDDNVPDVLEVAKYGVDASIKERQQALKEEEFTHKKEVDKEKLRLEKEKIKKQAAKASAN